MRPCFVALNSKISVATISVMPPQKSAQARKMFSVAVIAPIPWSCSRHDKAGPNIVEGLGQQEPAFVQITKLQNR